MSRSERRYKSACLYDTALTTVRCTDCLIVAERRNKKGIIPALQI